MKWEIVMGIEVHAELSTKSKIFCGCSTEFGGAPNTNVCPVCSGMPGALPVFNYAVLEYAIKLGLTLGCEITRFSKFDRKNYFYPDLPKAYQISQLYSPICTLGHLNIDGDGFSKSIGISEIHMEEDAGKLIHNLQTGNTLMNYNRCGVPLLEIVSQPDFRSAGEVIAYLEKLREILLYLDICDCKMQEGSIRADVNISVRPFGGQLGVRTEMKNLNSFKEISRAIEYESNRQIEILESGGEIEQETRRWDDAVGMSVGMRSKENAQDYRYFPEPDLLPLQVDESLIKKIGANLPELAHQKCERYIAQFGLTKYDATLITKYKNITILFESVAHLSGEPVEAANLITGELMRLMNKTGTQPEDLKIDSQKLADLIALVTGGKINRTAYKETVEAVYLSDVEPNAYIEEKGLLMLADTDIVTSAVKSVLEGNPDAIEDYKKGKEKAFGFLMGQVMKELRGAGDPKTIKDVLEKLL